MNVYVIVADIDIESKEVAAVVKGGAHPDAHIKEFKTWLRSNRRLALSNEGRKISKAEAFANWLVGKGYKKLPFGVSEIET